eukprot:1144209-Pelagomonas_calceolata.AAC.2
MDVVIIVDCACHADPDGVQSHPVFPIWVPQAVSTRKLRGIYPGTRGSLSQRALRNAITACIEERRRQNNEDPSIVQLTELLEDLEDYVKHWYWEKKALMNPTTSPNFRSSSQTVIMNNHHSPDLELGLQALVKGVLAKSAAQAKVATFSWVDKFQIAHEDRPSVKTPSVDRKKVDWFWHGHLR